MSEAFEIPEVRFEPDVAIAEAREKTGFDDFGDDDSFFEPMRVLMRALDEEAALTPMGRFSQYTRIVDQLASRLTATDWFKRHPEILDEEIREPIVIAGLARTGTTMLHRLLSADAQWHVPLWYEVRYPSPFPDDDAWRTEDARIAAGAAEVAMILETQPVLASIHPWDATGADEEIMLLEHGFLSGVPESGANVPSYREMAWSVDQRPAYAWMKRMFQFLQWQKKQRGSTAERWVMKAPHHLGWMDVLFETFPDARVVQTHRDPLETIPSVASMYYQLWRLASEAADPKRVGAQCLERWSSVLNRCIEQRAVIGEERFLDVSYEDVQRDALAQVERIYAFAGQPFSAEARAAMERWHADNRRDKRAPHVYDAADFGYTEALLQERFREYRARFIV